MSAYTHNLIILYQPNWVSENDFHEIARRIRQRTDAIEVFVTAGSHAAFRVRKKAAGRPTLVFSPGRIESFDPARGKIFAGVAIPKIEQMKRLDTAKLPVPKWTLLEENTKLDPAEWGEQVVLKPSAWTYATLGRGVQFVKTKNVKYLAPEEFPEEHTGRFGPMIVQKFVDTGTYPSEYRILCLFGAPLYEMYREAPELQPDPQNMYDMSDDRDLATFTGVKKFGFSGKAAKAKFTINQDVHDLARKVYEAIPEAPLQGVDIIRDKNTGEVYVLEFNPGGNTWHFSSIHAVKSPLIDGQRREDQLDAFSVCADELIKKTIEFAE